MLVLAGCGDAAVVVQDGTTTTSGGTTEPGHGERADLEHGCDERWGDDGDGDGAAAGVVDAEHHAGQHGVRADGLADRGARGAGR
jgi:hypothetical protein